jgi:hypothetical protein
MQNIELQNLIFALLNFALALIPSFLSMPPFFHFEMEICTLYHCVLEVYNLFFFFLIFYRGSEVSLSLRETSDFNFWAISELFRQWDCLVYLGDRLNGF